jgi:hypothetical protein
MHDDANLQSDATIIYQLLEEVYILLSTLEAQIQVGLFPQSEREPFDAVTEEKLS